MEEKQPLYEFTLQVRLPAPNAEIAKEVANKAQRLIDEFGYYQFLKLTEFIEQRPEMVELGLRLINK